MTGEPATYLGRGNRLWDKGIGYLESVVETPLHHGQYVVRSRPFHRTPDDVIPRS